MKDEHAKYHKSLWENLTGLAPSMYNAQHGGGEVVVPLFSIVLLHKYEQVLRRTSHMSRIYFQTKYVIKGWHKCEKVGGQTTSAQGGYARGNLGRWQAWSQGDDMAWWWVIGGFWVWVWAYMRMAGMHKSDGHMNMGIWLYGCIGFRVDLGCWILWTSMTGWGNTCLR